MFNPTKIISWVPPRFRVLAVIFVIVLCIFLYSKFRPNGSSNGSSTNGSRPVHMPFASEPPAKPGTFEPSAAAVPKHLVEVAVESIDKAGEASTVVDQLRHLTFGISQLEAAKLHVPSYDKLSSISGVDIRKLEAYLHRAEQMCVRAIKAERKPPTPQAP